MNKLLLLAAAVLLTACEPGYKDQTARFPILPPELKDCKVYRIEADGPGHIKVVRCPNSTVTTVASSGKNNAMTTIVDVDVPPVPKPAPKTTSPTPRLTPQEVEERKGCAKKGGEYLKTRKGFVCVITEQKTYIVSPT